MAVIKLENFIEREKQLLEDFKKYWEKSQNEDPENWIESMSDGDWYEQYYSWKLYL